MCPESTLQRLLPRRQRIREEHQQPSWQVRRRVLLLAAMTLLYLLLDTSTPGLMAPLSFASYSLIGRITMPVAMGTPHRQHRIPPARRHVMYRVPIGPNMGKAATAPNTASMVQEPATPGQLWHVLGDASQESPDHVFRRLRPGGGSPPDSSRPTEQTGFVNGDASQLAGIDTVPRNNTLDDFNVTAETEYNVSAPILVVGGGPADYNDDDNTNGSNDNNTSGANYTNYPNVSGLILYNGTTLNSSSATQKHDSATVLYTHSEPNDLNTSKAMAFRPIRIRAYLSEKAGGGEHLTEQQRTTLLQDIIRPALLSWSAALRVIPTQGNLTVDPAQLIDGIYCGGPDLVSMAIPTSHIMEGVPETDMIVYIALEFVPSTSTVSPDDINATSAPSGNFSTGNYSTNNYGTGNYSTSNNGTGNYSTSSNGTGNYSTGNYSIANTTAASNSSRVERTNRTMHTTQPHAATASPQNEGSKKNWTRMLALSTGGKQKNTGSRRVNVTKVKQSSATTHINSALRPKAVDSETVDMDWFNVSIDASDWFNTSMDFDWNETIMMETQQECAGDFLAASVLCSTDQYDRPTAAVLHICITESFFDADQITANIMTVQHELGHALGFNSESLAHFRRHDGSPITKRNKDGSIPLTEIECTGPLSNQSLFANVTLPSPEILQFRTVRGGIRVAQVVTPSVALVARNHFGCQQLPGAELQSGEALPTSTNPGEVSCFGDHWERRLFKLDLMNPIVEGLDFTPFISTLTLAFFADSGWYQVDLARAALTSNWGRGAGCDFVNKPCVGPDGRVPVAMEQFFCSETTGYDTKGYATDIQGCTTDLTRKAACSVGTYSQTLPPTYQYFRTTLGDRVGGVDPFMDYCPVYSGFSNGLCSDLENEALIRVNPMEIFGARNSRCLSGRTADTFSMALCLPIACVVEDRSLRVQIDGVWQICAGRDAILQTQGGDVVICPDPIRICPTFYCSRDCLGTNGECNFTMGDCLCNGTSCDSAVQESKGTLQMIFYDSDAGNSTRNDLPDQGSLADYYVPNERVLASSNRCFGWWSDWRIKLTIAATGFSFFLALLVLLCLGLRKRRLSDAAATTRGGDDHDGNVQGPTNPNKDKMIAAILVDMRMNTPPHLHEIMEAMHNRESETDLSMTDTDGGATTLPIRHRPVVPPAV